MFKTIVKVNKAKSHYATQWGVMNSETKQVIRTALTRRAARLFAKTSKNYVVIKRTIRVGAWKHDDPAKEYEQFWRI